MTEKHCLWSTYGNRCQNTFINSDEFCVEHNDLKCRNCGMKATGGCNKWIIEYFRSNIKRKKWFKNKTMEGIFTMKKESDDYNNIYERKLDVTNIT